MFTAELHDLVQSWQIWYGSADHSLIHWGRVMHICVTNLTIIGSDDGLAPGRCLAITWTNVGILLIWPLGTNFSEIFIEIQTISFKKIHLKMSSGKWRPFCLGLNVLTWSNAMPTDTGLLIIPPAQWSCWWGVYWFHSVPPSLILCPLCNSYTSDWIY